MRLKFSILQPPKAKDVKIEINNTEANKFFINTRNFVIYCSYIS